VLAICCLSLLIVGVDTTIVNVALPAIHRSLHASLAGLQWTIDAYTLVIATLLMLSGSTADRVGRKPTFQVGLILFTAGSAACAAAPNLGFLIGSRALQAIGGSMLNPVAMSIIRNVFHDPRERAQAVGIWGAAMAVSMGLGPVLGGFLVDSVGWRYVFLVNVPIGLVACVLTALFVPNSRAERPRRVDPVGQLLVIIGLASLVYAIIEGQADGWTSTLIVSLFIVAIVAFAALVRYERRIAEPLLDFRFFRSAPFAGASALAVCAFAAFGGFLFLNTLYLQEVRKMSALHAGLCTLPTAAMMIVMAPLSGRMIAKRGARLPLLLSGVGMLLSPLLLTQLAPHTSLAVLIASYVLFGLGLGTVNPPITNTAISGMPPAQAGVAAALASTSRQVGATLGIAVVGAVVGAGTVTGSFGAGFTSATHPGWWILVVLAVAILAIGVLTTTPWAHETAQRTSARLASSEAGS